MERLTYLNNGNAAYINSLYEAYQQNPESIEFGWQKFFEGFDFGAADDSSTISAATATTLSKEINVLNLIDGYRTRGHLFAKTNPVRERRQHLPGKELASFGLNDADLDTVFKAGAEIGLGAATLRDIRQKLEETYCGPIGVEYKYAGNPGKHTWFQDKMEAIRNKPGFSIEEKKRILHKLTQAVVFETFLQTKFLGQKRFSLEGGETLIPALDLLVEKGASTGVEEFIIGMGHRGRLNVLANIMGKPYKEIFEEFQGKTQQHDSTFSGDVKYHLGYSNDVTTVSGKPIHLSVCANPSHLEAVNAVVEGITRSKADFKYNGDNSRIVPVILHGDSSIAGQGIVYEVLQMEKLDGYRTGGTIHIVINNQVGFTTSNPSDTRSTIYSSDVAKMLEAPIFHVNADDPEAVVFVSRLALKYRMQFRKDVVIDLVCYRRHGHNEADEPAATQPGMYRTIREHPTARRLYADQLVKAGVLTEADAQGMLEQYRNGLDEGRPQARASLGMIGNKYTVDWSPYSQVDWTEPVPTGVELPRLRALGERITDLPRDFTLHPRVAQVMANRRKMVQGEMPLDWGCAETLAYASLVEDGFGVRLTGQDSGRGTF